MVRKGFIEQQIEMLATILAKVLFHRDRGDDEAVMAEINTAARKLVGVDVPTLDRLTDESVVSLFTHEGQLEAGKCLIAAGLLTEKAGVDERLGQEVAARAAYRKALRLHVAALLANDFLRSPDRQAQTETLRERLRDAELSYPLLRALFTYYEAIGRYDRAEDLLFELREWGETGWPGLATDFYRRLLMLPDAALEVGGLPRAEARAGLAEISNLERST